MTTTDVATTTAPPAAALVQLMTGYWVSQATNVAAKLRIADLLVDGPRQVDDLARATGTHAPSLYRLLRALASVGVFTEGPDGRFALTPIAELLRTGTPDSMHALALVYGDDLYRAWAHVLHSVRTGEVAFDDLYGMRVFEYFAKHPEVDAVFNEAMTSWSRQVGGAVAQTYDFSAFGTVVDIGGGHGALLASVLQGQRASRGVLFDLPHVVAGAGDLLTSAGSPTGARPSAATSSRDRSRLAATPTCSRRSCTTGTRTGASRSSTSAAA